MRKVFKICLWALFIIIGVPLIYSICSGFQHVDEEISRSVIFTSAFLYSIFLCFSLPKQEKRIRQDAEQAEKTGSCISYTEDEISFLKRKIKFVSLAYQSVLFSFLIIVFGFFVDTNIFVLLYLSNFMTATIKENIINCEIKQDVILEKLKKMK